MSGEKVKLKNQILVTIQNTVLPYVEKLRFVTMFSKTLVIFPENYLKPMKIDWAMSHFSLSRKKTLKFVCCPLKLGAYMGNAG